MTDGFYAPWAALAQEPWCFPPERIAGLTRRQCFELYLWPAAERAKGLYPTAATPTPGVTAWNWDRDGVPPRERFVPAAMGEWGMSEAEAVAVWERATAAERAHKGG